MADNQSILVDPSGKVRAFDLEHAEALISSGAGYIPAGKEQIEDFHKEQAFHEKYGTTGQQIATAGEGAAQALTFGLSDFLEQGLGVSKEDIANREKENPKSHMAGTIGGVALPAVATLGGAAAGEAASLSAPGLISKVGEAAGEGVGHLAGEGSSVAGRIAAKGAQAAATGLTEGAAYGAGQVVHEYALGDPHLTASNALEEIGLSSLLGGAIGGGTGVLGGLVGEAANSKMGQKLSEWMENYEGNQNIKTAAGPGKGQAAIRKLQKSGLEPNEVSKLGQDAADLGLIKPVDQPIDVFEKAEELKKDVGPKMGGVLREVDNSGWAKPRTINEIVADFRKNTLNEFAENPANRATADAFNKFLDANETRFGTHVGGEAAHDLTFQELHQLRREVSDEAYGFNKAAFVNPEMSKSGQLYSRLRQQLSDEITSGLDKAALPKATSEEWRELNRQYSIASKISTIAENGAAGRGLSGAPLSSVLLGGMFGAAHSVGAGLGVGLLVKAAKMYGPQALAAGARYVRNLVDEEAASSLASKTAEAISSGREAAQQVGEATRAARAWNIIGEKAEGAMAPAKDFIRDAAKEHIAESGEGTPIETVAALSQLEAANMRAQKKIEHLAMSAVQGKRVARGGVEAISADVLQKKLNDIRSAVANPEALLNHVADATNDLHSHAPTVSQAISTKAGAAAAFLTQNFPPHEKPGPLASEPKMTDTERYRMNQAVQVIDHPSLLLGLMANKRLTKAHVQAVEAVHPEHLAAQRKAVLNHLSTGIKPPHSQRLMLSTFLGQDMDGSTRPQSIQNNQLIYRLPSAKSGENQTGPAAMGKTNQSGLNKLDMSKASLLPGQAAETRR